LRHDSRGTPWGRGGVQAAQRLRGQKGVSWDDMVRRPLPRGVDLVVALLRPARVSWPTRRVREGFQKVPVERQQV
jgi:hypothetical protein